MGSEGKMWNTGMAIICVLEGKDEGSSIEGKGTSWKSRTAGVKREI